jgi:hypothetical protein
MAAGPGPSKVNRAAWLVGEYGSVSACATDLDRRRQSGSGTRTADPRSGPID